MENDNEVVNPPIRERTAREPSRDPLPSDGTQGNDATGNEPTEGDEGGAGIEVSPYEEPEED
jgi:hypothetical protein